MVKIMVKKFTRTIENFICEHCGEEVLGNGYTNHCPKCLWSKHVDKNPGDRLETCGGMMKPIKGEKRRKDFVIIQKCVKCGFEKRNILNKNDDFDVFIDLSKKLSVKI